ncbi:putative ATP-dependent zinc protease, partial [Vibrio diabolicus]
TTQEPVEPESPKVEEPVKVEPEVKPEVDPTPEVEPKPEVKPEKKPEPKPTKPAKVTKTPDGMLILGSEEWVYVPEIDQTFKARVDTGATTSSISAKD